MKTPKTYRFSPQTIHLLDRLMDYSKDWAGKWTETDVVEHAIGVLFSLVETRDNHQPI